MWFTDPRDSQSTANQAEVTQADVDAAKQDEVLLSMVNRSVEIDEKLTSSIGQISEGMNNLTTAVSDVSTRLVSLESKQEEIAKTKSSDVCECDERFADNEAKLTDHEARLKALESRGYPAVSSSTGYGSTGTPVASGGSTGSPTATGYASSGGVASKSPATPVRNAVRNVANRFPSRPPAGSGHWSHDNEPIDFHLQTDHGVGTSGMSHEAMLSLHDSLHEGTRTASSPPMRSAVRSSNCPGGVCPTGPPVASGGGWYLGKNLGFRR